MGYGRNTDPRRWDGVVTVVVIVAAIVAVVVVLAVIVAVVARRRHGPDGVAEFQRHIGALSSEARRPIVDRVQRLEGGRDDTPNRVREQGRDG